MNAKNNYVVAIGENGVAHLRYKFRKAALERFFHQCAVVARTLKAQLAAFQDEVENQYAKGEYGAQTRGKTRAENSHLQGIDEQPV